MPSLISKLCLLLFVAALPVVDSTIGDSQFLTSPGSDQELSLLRIVMNASPLQIIIIPSECDQGVIGAHLFMIPWLQV